MQTAPKAAKVTGRQEISVEGGPGEIVSLDLEFLDGVVSSITVGNAIPEKRRLFAAQFDEETLLVDDLAEMKLTRYSGLRVRELDHRSPEQLLKKHPAVHIPTEDTLPLTQAVEEFAQGIRDPLDLPSSFGVEPALAVTRVLAACENDKEYR
jgi:DNA-directed RNA polymerase subunit K/omega